MLTNRAFVNGSMVIVVAEKKKKNKKENPAFREKLKKILFEGCDVKGVHYTFKNNQEFADFLGVSRQTLGFWLHEKEEKRRSPDMDGLIKVSKALNMSIDYLVGLTESNTYDADVQAVIRYTGLSERFIYALRDMVFQGDMQSFLNGFVESPFYKKFAIGYAHTYALANSVNKYNKGGSMRQRIEFADSNSFIMVTDFSMLDVLHSECDRMCRYITEYANSYFDSMLDEKRTDELTNELPENGQDHVDSEVK